MDIHRRLIERVYRAHLDTIRARSAKADARGDVKVAESRRNQASAAHELAEQQLSAAEKNLVLLQQSLGKCDAIPTQSRYDWCPEDVVLDQPQRKQFSGNLHDTHECSTAFVTADTTSSSHALPALPIRAPSLQFESHGVCLEQPLSTASPPNHSLTTLTTPHLSAFSPFAEGSSSTIVDITEPYTTEEKIAVPRHREHSSGPASNLENTKGKKKFCFMRLCCVFDIANGIKRRASRSVFKENGACDMS